MTEWLTVESLHQNYMQIDPFLKFLCVKLVVFFCFWQSCVLSILGSLGKHTRLDEKRRKTKG
jgi:hypothetical protein